jgi:uncharacterized protein (DUF305 family)
MNTKTILAVQHSDFKTYCLSRFGHEANCSAPGPMLKTANFAKVCLLEAAIFASAQVHGFTNSVQGRMPWFVKGALLAGLLVFSASPSIAQHTQHHHHGSSSTGQVQNQDRTTAAAAQQQAELSELEALYWQRQHESRQNFVQADVDFMTDMIVHHAQALIMSRLSPDNGASAAVKRLSARIINAQQDEIATMQRWLRDRGQSVPLVHFEGIDMHVSMEAPRAGTEHGHPGSEGGHDAGHEGHSTHTSEHAGHEGHSTHTSTHTGHESHSEHDQHAGHEGHSTHTSTHTGHESHSEHDQHAGHEGHSTHTSTHAGHEGHAGHSTAHAGHGDHHGHAGHNHDDMIGMLNQAQMEELATARGSEFDRLFLTYMIMHHEGAVYMVNELFMADGAGTDLESYRLAVDIYAEQVTEIAMMRKMLEEMGFHVPEPLPELLEQQERLRNTNAASAAHEHQGPSLNTNNQDHSGAGHNRSGHHQH